MVNQARLAQLKDRLPWRVRRRLEQWQLASFRFVQGQSTFHVRDGSAAASLIAVGDVALAGSVGTALQHKGAARLLQGISSLFRSADLLIGNLETVLTGADTLKQSIGGFIKASPAAIELLTSAGFNVVTLANNHARDCRLEGLLQCCQLLREHGIQYCGAGPSPEQSRAPAIVEVAGLKVGILGYCDNFRIDADEAENVAPAPACDDWIVADIHALRRRVDVLILQLHWGWEFSFYPLLSYRDRARQLAEAGADLVLCHHAHIPMGVEVWKTSLISHGLGNFIFQRSGYLLGGHPWTYRSYALKVSFDGQGVLRAEIVPCVLDGDGIPQIATDSCADEILGGIGRASTRLNDDRLLTWIEQDRTVRDTTTFFASFSKSDSTKAREWALHLRSPFQQANINRLRLNYGTAGDRLATFMQEVAESFASPTLSASLVEQSREGDFDAMLTSLHKANPIPEDLPGRVP